jgi:hypothetical protein
VQGPGGTALFVGHDESRCAGCNRLAVLVLELTVPVLELVHQFPVCGRHRAEAEADLRRDFGAGQPW